MTILNLQKNDILDLTKKNPSLNNLIVGTGWDVVKPKGLFGGLFGSGSDYDLDLFALKLDSEGKLMSKGIVYFGAKIHEGIHSTGDNITGEGEGDDEQIIVNLDKLPVDCERIVFAVAIYQANQRGQKFSNVENAFVRLVDMDKGRSGEEICRFNLTENGGDNTAIIMAELIKNNGNWSFKAIGQYLKANIEQISRMYI